MSGGSFDYLFSKMECGEALPENMRSMIAEMRRRGIHKIADELEARADAWAAVQKRYAKLAQTIEWHVSSDWGPERIDEELKRLGHEPQHIPEERCRCVLTFTDEDGVDHHSLRCSLEAGHDGLCKTAF